MLKKVDEGSYVFKKILISIFIMLLNYIIYEYNYRMGILMIAISVMLIAILMAEEYAKAKEIKRQSALDILKLRQEKEINSSPILFVVLSASGEIIWGNSKFSQICQVDSLQNKSIGELMGLDVKSLKEESGEVELESKKKSYYGTYSRQNTCQGEEVIKLYLIDITRKQNEIKEHEETRLAVGLIYVDNFEDIFGAESNIDQSKSLAKLDDLIYVLANRINGFVEKVDEYKYLVLFENRYLNFLESRKFEILDEVKDIDFGGRLPLTISIGIGFEGKTIKETYKYAKSAMDVALGRGGDQAVVKSNEKLEFYAGKTKAVEKRAKVKARVVSHALKEIIDQSDTIFIMGHKSPDLDCFGAAIGMYRVVKTRGKDAYIVLDKVTESIRLIYDNLKKDHSEYIENIVSPKDTKKLIDENSLCIIVDTHKLGYLEFEGLLKKVKNVVIIDHHRLGKDVIADTIISYIEPYASSTCELVTEIIYYIAEDAKLQKVEAEALLAGIALDTKNFSIKTGVRTFEAASFLRRKGADTEIVRKLFRTSVEDLKLKATAIESAEVIAGCVAIAKFHERTGSANLIAAQVADELLNTTTIKASFVLCLIDDSVHISARSVDEFNVQYIMEQLGGGGHLNAAGARIKDASIDECIEKIKELIEENTKEGER